MESSTDGDAHWSDCSVNNGPAYPAGPCDCGGLVVRGIRLPNRMTPECLDEMAALVNRHCRDVDGDLDVDVAVKLFNVVVEHLRASEEAK